jgi:membrane protein YqaA with SNARE-associated domain
VGEWLLVWALVVALNLAPAFAPPTWSLLAYFHVRHNLPVWPLALVGAAGASAGRAGLALGSRVVGPRFVSAKRLRNIQTLSETLEARKGLSLPALTLFCVGPIPSNDLFIAAGLAKTPLLPLLGVFGLARFVSYVLWVMATGAAADSLRQVLTPRFGNVAAIAVELAGVVGLVLLLRLDWARVVRRWLPSGEQRAPEE